MSSENKHDHQPDSGPVEGTSRASKRDQKTDPFPTTSRSFLDKYTVGWMSALPLEMAAAKGMLDEIHPNLTEQDPEDHNTYLLGEVFGHNVVVACLPAGVYGPTTAATVAKDMRRTFRSIRFGLMVGIGGGIPSKKHDIRLGDVVVGQPTATTGGVIQYDLGKSLQDQGFERTGMLNAPPQVLLAALSRLQAEHLTEDTRIPEFLADLPKKMKKRFGHPGVSNDHLFLAKYTHIKDNPTCEQCDHTQMVDREDQEDTEPVVHYGTIASGNQVIKDATVRDQLGRELGILCFEMEAAGLQDYPSLTVRGICDYADSHKNDDWQYYAAATAAAFTKELLSLIPPPLVLQQDPLPQLVSIANETLDLSKQHLDLSSKTLGEQRRTNQILEDRAVDLHVVHEACYNSADVGDSPRCEANTRVRIQQTIRQWADEDNGEPFLWLVGPAGTGKSTLIRSVADSLHQEKRLAAGYFFKRGEQGRNDTSRLFSTLAMQLADAVSCFKNSLRVSVGGTDSESMDKKDLRFQFERLLKNPLQGLDFDTGQAPKAAMVIVLDALDECEVPENLPRILSFLSEICKRPTALKLHVLLASRPEIMVTRALEPLIQDGVTRKLDLRREFPEDTKADVRLYLENSFMRIKIKNKIQQDPWPTFGVLDHLVELSITPEPLFIYAATLLRFIYDERRWQNPKNQLKIWLGQCEEDKSQLHQMYSPMLEQIFAFGKDTDFDAQMQFLGAVALVATPLPLTSLTSLLALDVDDVVWWLPGLHAVLDIPSESNKPIRLLHKSFIDYLLSKGKHGYARFHLNVSDIHTMLAHKCIDLMTRCLKRDICDLKKLDASPDKVKDARFMDCVPSELQYSCFFWVYHLQAVGHPVENGNKIYKFLLQHFLHWIEVLALFKRVSYGLQALRDLADSIEHSSNSPDGLFDFLRDAIRVLLAFASTIESAPLQTYASLILFSPTTSRVRRCFWDHRLPPHSNVEGVKSHWDAHLQTLNGSTIVTGLAFSPDGKLLASAEATVHIWNASTGTHLITLEAALHPSNMTFSSSSRLLAASHEGCLVTIWDTASWIELQTLECSGDRIKAIVFSADDEVLVAAAASGTVQFWNIRLGMLQRTVNISDDYGDQRATTISPNLRLAASTTKDAIVFWDLATSTFRHRIPVKDWVCSIVFSPNSKRLAAALGKRIVVWDTATFRPDCIMEDSDYIHTLAFSSDGQLLPSKSADKVRVWDMSTGAYRDLGQDGLNAVAFSPDNKVLATAKGAAKIRLWDLDYSIQHSFKAFSERKTIAFSRNGRFVVSHSGCETLQFWDAVTGKFLKELVYAPSYLNIQFSPDLNIQFSPDSRLLAWKCGYGIMILDIEEGTTELDSRTKILTCPIAYSANSQLAAVCWNDTDLNLYDTVSGSRLYKYESQVNGIRKLFLSPNGEILASLSGDRIIRLWNTKTLTLQCHIEQPNEISSDRLIFSPNGEVLAQQYTERIYWWDVATGVHRNRLDLRTLESFCPCAFSANLLFIAAAVSYPQEQEDIKLYNVKSDDDPYTLYGHFGKATQIVFSPDNLMLVVASDDRTVRIWDTVTHMLQHTLQTYNDAPEMARFSPDGAVLATVSFDETVRIWHTKTGQLLRFFRPGKGPIQDVFLSSNELVVSVSGVKSSQLWNAWDSQMFKLSRYSYSLLTDTSVSILGRVRSEVSLDADNTWIMIGFEKTVFIPQEYRPEGATSWAKRGQVLFLICPSGQVISFRGSEV